MTRRGKTSKPSKVAKPSRLEKRTLVPPYDPVGLARAVQTAASYARVVESRIDSPEPETITAVAAPISDPAVSGPPTEIPVTSLARAMYASYLESDFPEALVLAEKVVAKEPDHALAQAVVARCRAVLGDALRPTVGLESRFRLRADAREIDQLPVDAKSIAVLQHVEGATDAATVAERAGISRVEALEHLNALCELGVLEVVGG